MLANPVTKKVASVREFHGDKFIDEYEWLRDKENPEVIQHLEDENAYCEKSLANLKNLRSRLFEETKARVNETDMSLPSRCGDYWYFIRTQEGKDYAKFCRLHLDYNGGKDNWIPPKIEREKILEGEVCYFDANVVADKFKKETGSDFFSIGSTDISEDGKLRLWSVDISGDERYTCYFMNIETGEDLPDVLENVMQVAFDVTGKYVFYTKPDDAWRSFQLWRHTIGDHQKDDTLIYEEKDEKFNVSFGITGDKKNLTMSVNASETDEMWFLDAKNPTGEFKVFWPRKEGVEYAVSKVEYGDKTYYFVIHNIESENYDIDLYDENKKLIGRYFSSTDETMLGGIGCSKNFLLYSVREDAVDKTYFLSAQNFIKYGLKSADMFEEIRPKDDLEIYSLGAGTPEYDSPVLLISYSSFTSPSKIFLRDLRKEGFATGENDILLKEQEVLPSLSGEIYDQSKYREKRIWIESRDGVKIPVYLIWRKDKVEEKEVDGFGTLPINAPVLLSGYGAYGHSTMPGFLIGLFQGVDRGIVRARVGVRGGMELGKKWYLNGKKLKKKNSFTDFVDCAQGLVNLGVCKRGEIVASGGSAGGLLVGAALNISMSEMQKSHPLFKAVVAQVPFVDALTSILKPELPLTIPEWEEWGDPLHNKDVYEYMKSYSPYENIVNVENLEIQNRPEIFAITSLNDTRVLYVEPAKWVAKLRDNSYPAILKCEMVAGHGGVTGRYNSWKEAAFDSAFIFNRLLGEE